MLNPEISAQLEEMRPVGLSALESVALLNRTDTKYLMSESQALCILRACGTELRVLEIDGRRASYYSTQYFDTPDLAMYLDHHNGMRDRYKVRLRSYVEISSAWLEIKRKTNLERTIKRRMSLPEVDPDLGDDAVGSFTREEAHFIRQCTPYDPHALRPNVNNEFKRITLASLNPAQPERVTIDVGLHLRWLNQTLQLTGIVIAEVKRPRSAGASIFARTATEMGIHPTPFSKYCMAIAMLAPGVRANLFKETIRKVRQLMQDTPRVYSPSLPALEFAE